MNRLPRFQALAERLLTRNADLLYRHTQDFVQGVHTWPTTRFSVVDPDKVSRQAVTAATAAAARFEVAYSDLRLLKIHPADTLPAVGSSTPWDGGRLDVLEWSQASDFTGQRVGTCVIRR